MSFKLLGGGSDLNGVVSDMNQNILELKGREVTEVFKDDTGTRRVLSGKRGDDYGLFVSKPTFDVFSAADDELAFNSNNNVFKIVASGTVTLPKDASDAFNDISISHDLGFIPAVLAYGEVATGRYNLLPYNEVNVSTGIVDLNISIYQIDASSLELAVTAPSTGPYYADAMSIPIRYYLLQETAT